MNNKAKKAPDGLGRSGSYDAVFGFIVNINFCFAIFNNSRCL